MNWNKLLCKSRERKSSSANMSDIRTEFRKDYQRIIGSASFRRLQDKAQVYPLKRGDFVRTRLTHSLEVSSFAGSLADTVFKRLINRGTEDIDDSVRENCRDILECAGLVHDIGNPPFGHFGEFAIRQWFEDNLPRLKFRGQPVDGLLSEQMKADFLNFEGNAQALRILARLHCLRDMDYGMNLTYALLNTIIKYPVSSVNIDAKSGNIKTKKMGYFYAERELFAKVSQSTGALNDRYPLTFLLEAADDIAYKTADIEDAAIKGYVDYDLLADTLNRSANGSEVIKEALDSLEGSLRSAEGLPDTKQKAVQQWIIGIQSVLFFKAADAFCDNYDAIMAGEFKTELLSASPAGELAGLLGDIAYKYAFRSSDIVKSELSESAVMRVLLDKITEAALRFDTEDERIFDRDLSGVLSENYLELCRRSCENSSLEEQCYYRLLFATDCISGMTDSYARDFCRLLSGG